MISNKSWKGNELTVNLRQPFDILIKSTTATTPDRDIPRANPKIGWGTWIRTKDARVRAESFTAKLSPIGPRKGAGRSTNTHPPRQQAARWPVGVFPGAIVRSGRQIDPPSPAARAGGGPLRGLGAIVVIPVVVEFGWRGLWRGGEGRVSGNRRNVHNLSPDNRGDESWRIAEAGKPNGLSREAQFIGLKLRKL